MNDPSVDTTPLVGAAQQPRAPCIPYKEPEWGCSPKEGVEMWLEMMKNGAVLERFALARSYTTIGRQSGICNIALIHPTVSRMHAVLQHGKEGELYICDRGSTHGTQLNMSPVKANTFVRLHVGDIISFGYSSRFFVLDGPDHLRRPETNDLRDAMNAHPSQ